MSAHSDHPPSLYRVHEYNGEPDISVDVQPPFDNLTRGEKRAILNEWIDFFRVPQPIRALHLWCRVNDELLSSIRGQSGLHKLVLYGGPYTNLSAVGELSSLTYLSLGGASRLTDLSPLAGLRQLEFLEVENGRRLRDYSPIGRITSLRSLHVVPSFTGGRTDADSVDFLRNLPHLDEVMWSPRVVSGDYSPFLALTDATELGIDGVKGMTPSLMDLEWALPGLQAYNRRIAEQRIPIVSAEGVTMMVRDVTGRTSFEPPTEEDLTELEQSDDEPDLGASGFITGTTIRVYSRTARTHRESFILEIDQLADGRPLRLPPEQREMGRYGFAGDLDEPLVVWESPLVLDADEAEEFFAGNREVSVGALPFSVDVDASDRLPLESGDFWPIVDVLTGRLHQNGCVRSEVVLAARDDEFVLRWAQTMGLHASALVPTIEELVHAGVVPPGRELDAIGIVIGQGREVYERVRADSGAFDRRWLRKRLSAVLWIGSGAMFRRRPEVRRVLTIFTPTMEALNHAAYGDSDSWDEEWEDARCVRAIVRGNQGVVERIVLATLPAGDATAREQAARAAVIASGGEILAGPEIGNTPCHQPGNFDTVFTIRRHSTQTDEDYLGRYVPRE